MRRLLFVVGAPLAFAVFGCANQHNSSSYLEARPPRIVVMNTPPEFRQYDESFVNEVQQRWFDLLNNGPWRVHQEGRVIVRFRLHDDGRITNTLVLTNTTDDIMLDVLGQKAILGSQPYPPWPQPMRAKVSKSYRGIDFSFYDNGLENQSSAGKKKSPVLKSSENK